MRRPRYSMMSSPLRMRRAANTPRPWIGELRTTYGLFLRFVVAVRRVAALDVPRVFFAVEPFAAFGVPPAAFRFVRLAGRSAPVLRVCVRFVVWTDLAAMLGKGCRIGPGLSHASGCVMG